MFWTLSWSDFYTSNLLQPRLCCVRKVGVVLAAKLPAAAAAELRRDLDENAEAVPLDAKGAPPEGVRSPGS